MERFEVRESVESILPVLIDLEAELRLAASTGLATATLVFLLLCATREGMAQTGAASGALGGGSQTAMLATTGTVDAAEVALVIDPAVLRRARELDLLLAVRGGSTPITAQQTDAAIASAVAEGSAGEVRKRNPFAKRSNDLFRARRQVQVGRQEMEIRLRVRPKTRETMAVELRF